MSKLKTHKAAAKRILKRKKSGVLVARSMSAQHRTSGKSTRVGQQSRHTRSLSKANEKRFAKLLPYSR